MIFFFKCLLFLPTPLRKTTQYTNPMKNALLKAICFCGGHWQRKFKLEGILFPSSYKIRCRFLCAGGNGWHVAPNTRAAWTCCIQNQGEISHVTLQLETTPVPSLLIERARVSDIKCCGGRSGRFFPSADICGAPFMFQPLCFVPKMQRHVRLLSEQEAHRLRSTFRSPAERVTLPTILAWRQDYLVWQAE